MNIKYQLIVTTFLSLFLIGCADDEAPVLSSDREITYFAFEEFSPPAVGEINNADGIITVEIPFGADPSSLTPTIEVPESATVNPPSGEPQDFTDFVIYTVTAETGAKKNYTVLVSEGPSNNAKIAEFTFPDLFRTGTINHNAGTITFDVPFGTEVNSITTKIVTVEENATVSPASETAVDYSNPVNFTVTAPDQVTEKVYTVTVNVMEQETGVRGVWLTNVDSNVLDSKAGIEDAVQLVAELNVNTIFVVVYNKASTTYPSQVMQDLIGVTIDPRYEGRDPLRELIDAAHAKNIKVLAWFEYGFAAFNGRPGPILEAHPEWGAINNQGNQVVKNGFYWLNSLLPEVQNFMDDLVLEVVNNYPDIDGIQGDDRLPAMPSEGGYDTYTVEQYKLEHDGALPPSDPQDGKWLEWRASRLNTYGQNLYNKVKAANPNAIVAMSPSPMSFGYREYLQDYVSWVEGGYADIISPQLYRRDSQGISVYRGLLLDQLRRISPEHKDIFYPGILTFLGGYTPDPEFYVNMINENRKAGVTGEVHFFYNSLLAQPEVFRSIYPAPAIFPTF